MQTVVFGGRATGVPTGAFLYNQATNDAVVTTGLSAGDAYRFSAWVPTVPSARVLADASAAPVSLPPLTQVPQAVAVKAEHITQSISGDFAKAYALAKWLRDTGAFSNGLIGQLPSLPGHGSLRMAQFFAPPAPIGDAEQYASAMALMARSIGLPSRVVLGVVVNRPKSMRITGRDVTAWTEIDLAGVGWYPFNCTPPPTRMRVLSSAAPRSQAGVTHSNRLPSSSPAGSPAAVNGATRTGVRQVRRHNRTAQRAGGVPSLLLQLGLPALLFTWVLASVIWLKHRRRSRRRRSPTVSGRILGGWRELVDVARDLGIALPVTGTRSEVLAVLGIGDVFLAQSADAAAFGPGEPPDDLASRYWEELDGAVGRLRVRVGRLRRAAALLNPRSLRDRPRQRGIRIRGGSQRLQRVGSDMEALR
ncbi:MAG: transglutaminase-like domain-containing protein [Acidimicrobiales bacterium]